MTRINLNDYVERATSTPGLLGEFHVVIDAAEEKTVGQGSSQTSKIMIEATVLGKFDENGVEQEWSGSIVEWFQLEGKGVFKIMDLLKAMGAQTAKTGVVEVYPARWVGEHVMVSATPRTYTDKAGNAQKATNFSWFPLPGAKVQDAAAEIASIPNIPTAPAPAPAEAPPAPAAPSATDEVDATVAALLAEG